MTAATDLRPGRDRRDPQPNPGRPGPLERGRSLYLPAMRQAVARLEPTSRTVASYHLGWSDPQGRPVEGGGGKALRPALALLSAEAVAAPAETGLPGAVAVQLVHDFSLLHDDLMDRDLERRHRPTAWVVFGAGPAVLAGDAMLALAQDVLLEGGDARAVAAARLLARTVGELVRGQSADLAFESRHDVGLGECLDMAAGKTGALLAASAAVGAVLAGAEAREVEALSAYGECVGLAFQLVDDLLGIWGDPATTGKPVLADLRARKKSLPVTYALSEKDRNAEQLREWLATDPADDDEASLRHAAALVERAGGRDWAAEEADRQVGLAEAALDSADLTDPARTELVELARSLVSRRS